MKSEQNTAANFKQNLAKRHKTGPRKKILRCKASAVCAFSSSLYCPRRQEKLCDR